MHHFCLGLVVRAVTGPVQVQGHGELDPAPWWGTPTAMSKHKIHMVLDTVTVIFGKCNLPQRVQGM